MFRFLLPLALLAAPAAAQRASHCIAVAEGPRATIQQAGFRSGLSDWEVRLSYVDHSMFLIETGGGATAVTDYNGYIGPTGFAPDVVTMNRAHSSHWTSMPDPAIPHVLRGWEGEGQILEVADLLVRNVTTDIRGSVFDERGSSAVADGNSIYVFEAAGLCIAHLGHLHHAPDDGQYAALGRMDVVMAPVDGGLTLPRSTLLETLDVLKARVVIPMHWFGRANMERFVDDMVAAGYDEVRPGGPDWSTSLADLPDRPTVLVLDPEWLTDPD